MRNPGSRKDGILRLKKSVSVREQHSLSPCPWLWWIPSVLWRALGTDFPPLVEGRCITASFYCLCFHLPSKHTECKDCVRKQFFIKLPMHSLSSPYFLWGPEFFVLLTRTVTVIYCFVLSGCYDHNSTNPVNPATMLMWISLGKCRHVYSVLKFFLSFCPCFFVLEWQWSHSVIQ